MPIRLFQRAAEEAEEKVVVWEQSLCQRLQSGCIRLYQLEALLKQTQRGISCTRVHTPSHHSRHNNGNPDILSCRTVRLLAEAWRLSVGYV